MASANDTTRHGLEDESGRHVTARTEDDPNYIHHSVVAQALDGGWEIAIPDIDGAYMAGLAVGLDPALADDDKLPTNINDTVRRARTRVAFWAYDHYASYPRKIREGFVAGAVAAVTCGLLRTYEGKPDGDFRYVKNRGIISKAKAEEISRMMTNEAQFRALALIVSTKAQWWACNHHTGQSYTETTGLINAVQTLGLIKRIILYSIRFASTNAEKKETFSWREALTLGIKELLTGLNITCLFSTKNLVLRCGEKP